MQAIAIHRHVRPAPDGVAGTRIGPILLLVATALLTACSKEPGDGQLPLRPTPGAGQLVVVEDGSRVRRDAIRSSASGEWDWTLAAAIERRTLRFEWAVAASATQGSHKLTVDAFAADGKLIRTIGSANGARDGSASPTFRHAELEGGDLPQGARLRFKLDPPAELLLSDVRLISKHRGPAPVVLIVFDTVRADAVGIGGSVDPSSPNVDAIFRDGWISSRAYAPASWTIPSVASLLTGRVPAANEDADGSPLGIVPAVPTIADDFRAAGWSTAAFVANPTLHAGNGFARGFDSFFTTPYEVASITLPATATMQHALPWIASHEGEPYFLWIHLMDPHDPYTPPDRARGTTPFDPAYKGAIVGDEVHRLYLGELPKPDARDIRHLQALYHDEVRFADHELGRFWGALPEDTRRRATFVFTSDHGEEIGEHGGWKHGPTLWNEVIRVPLAIRSGKGRPAPALASDALVTLLDIVPTLEAMAGLPPRERLLDGKDLLDPATAGRRVLPPVTMLTGGPVRAAVIRDGSKLVFFDARNTRAFPDPKKDPEGAKLAALLPTLLPALGRFEFESDRGERALVPVDASTFADDWRAIEESITHTRKGIEVRLIAPVGSGPREIVLEGVPKDASVEPFALDAGDRADFGGEHTVLTADASGDVDGFLLRSDAPIVGLFVTQRGGAGCTELVTSARVTLPSGTSIRVDPRSISSSIPRLETTDPRCAGLFVWRAEGRLPTRAPAEIDEERKKLHAIGYVH